MQFHTRAAALCAVLMIASAAHAEEPTPQPPCQSPEARQFDFWAGEWTVTANGELAGTNRISRIQNGCTLLEEFEAAKGDYEGKSFNYFDPGDGHWHQVWVDSGGLRLNLSGTYADGKMVMSGGRVRRNGEKVVDRITWFDNDDGTVRQLWEYSKDGGTTWSPAFDGLYERVEE